MNYTDIMVDIETLDTLPTAAITQIGAFAFNLAGGPGCFADEAFSIRITPDLTKRTASFATIQFWMKQSEEARASVFGGASVLLAAALAQFKEWYVAQGDVVRVWAMPPSFDIAILENAMQAEYVKPPWAYNHPRCVRTLADIAGARKEDRIAPIIPHDAGSDAMAQALSVRKYMDMLKGAAK